MDLVCVADGTGGASSSLPSSVKISSRDSRLLMRLDRRARIDVKPEERFEADVGGREPESGVEMD